VELQETTDEALAQVRPLEDVTKSLGVSLSTLNRWRTEYGSTDRDAVKRLKELERENGRFKRVVADQALNMQIFKEAAKAELWTRRYGVGPSNTSHLSSRSRSVGRVA
jgi:putative transposase